MVNSSLADDSRQDDNPPHDFMKYEHFILLLFGLWFVLARDTYIALGVMLMLLAVYFTVRKKKR